MYIIYFFLILLICILIYFLFFKKPKLVYEDDDLMIEKIRNDLYKINPASVNFNYFSSNESYTEDKKNVYLCLRDEHGQYYDYNMLMYVAIHELSHALSSTVDTKHTGLEFNNNFTNLLNTARNLGIYDPNKPLINHYCPLKK